MAVPEPPPGGVPQQDLWQKWFWRAVNVVGVLLIVREAFQPEPSWPILLVGLAFVVGAAGVQLILKGPMP